MTNEGLTNDDDDEDEDEVSFVAIIEERVERTLITSTSIHKNYIVHSGFPHHMLGDRSKFHEVEAYDGGMVKFDKNSPCTMISKGTISLNESTNYGYVYLVKGLKYNLLIMAKLIEKVHKFEFNKGSFRIFDKTCKLLAIGEQSRGNIFYLNIFNNI